MLEEVSNILVCSQFTSKYICIFHKYIINTPLRSIYIYIVSNTCITLPAYINNKERAELLKTRNQKSNKN